MRDLRQRPWASRALMMTVRFFAPSASWSKAFSSLTACCLASFTSRNLPWRKSAISRALRSSVSTMTSSPARATSCSPWISTGIAGPASLIGLPFSSFIARTRPNTAPARTTSPFLRVPDLMRSVATGPRPLSRRDSITTPLAGAWTGAFSSSTSDCKLDRLEKLVDALAGLGRDLDELDLAAELFADHVVRKELLLDASRVRLGLVDLVHRNDHRHLRRLGMVDRLDGLRHEAVVGGDHQLRSG